MEVPLAESLMEVPLAVDGRGDTVSKSQATLFHGVLLQATL